MTEDMSHPHRDMPLLERGSPLERARGAVILMHGRGDDAKTIMMLYHRLGQLESKGNKHETGQSKPESNQDKPGTDPQSREYRPGSSDNNPEDREEGTDSNNTNLPGSELGSQSSKTGQQNSKTSPGSREPDPDSLVPSLAWFAPQARDNIWYPLTFMNPISKNETRLKSAFRIMEELIDTITAAGIPKEKIMLGGFSQGAILASEFTARNPDRYGGLVALSGGLMGSELDHRRYQGSLRGMPVFLGCSDHDPYIPEHRVHETAEVFERLDADVTKKIYPGLGHTVNRDELEHFLSLLKKIHKENE